MSEQICKLNGREWLVQETARQLAVGNPSFDTELNGIIAEIAARFPRLNCTPMEKIIKTLTRQAQNAGEEIPDPIQRLRGSLEMDGVSNIISSKITNTRINRALESLACGKTPAQIEEEKKRYSQCPSYPFTVSKTKAGKWLPEGNSNIDYLELPERP